MKQLRLAGWAALFLLCGFRLWAAARVPLLPDEAYYWVWSRALAPGYFDHPPMIALWIKLGTMLAGQTEVGIRLLAPLSELLASFLLARAARDLMPEAGPSAGLAAALMMNATLFWGVAGEAMTPDVPLLLFWIAALAALGRLIATNRPAWWLPAGLAVGLAMDSKYTAALLAIGIPIWLCEPSRRFWWRNPWPYAGGLLALALFTPVLCWNATHGWASFIRQGARLGAFRLTRVLISEFGLVFGQLAAATPIIAILCAIGALAVWRRWREPRAGLLAVLIWPGAALFAEHALADSVQANWPTVLYPAAIVASLKTPARWRFWGTALGLALGIIFLGALAADLIRLPSRWSVVPLRREAVQQFVDKIAQASKGAAYIATDDYGLASLLAWYFPGRQPILALDYRWPRFNLPPAEPLIRAHPGILMLRLRPDPGSHWADKILFERVPSVRGSQTELLYHLEGVRPGKWKIPGAVLPRK